MISPRKIKCISTIFTFSFILLFSFSVFAQEENAFKKRGHFSLTPYGGIEQILATNANGGLSEFSNNQFGLRMSFRPLLEALPAFQLFADTAMASGENQAFNLETMETISTRFGSTYHINYFLFVGGAFGTKNIKVENENSVLMDLTTNQTGIGLGIDFLSFGDGMSFTFEAWRYSGYGPAGEDQSFNVGTQSYEYFLSIRWSPTIAVGNVGN